MSDMMSVMKTKVAAKKKAKPVKKAEVLPTVFTVRDMNRNSAKVLAACRQHGAVVVKHRAGESFTLKPNLVMTEPKSEEDHAERVRATMERMERHWARMGELGCQGPTTTEGIERVNMIIAGEI
jgi:hypothetical protein